MATQCTQTPDHCQISAPLVPAAAKRTILWYSMTHLFKLFPRYKMEFNYHFVAQQSKSRKSIEFDVSCHFKSVELARYSSLIFPWHLNTMVNNITCATQCIPQSTYPSLPTMDTPNYKWFNNVTKRNNWSATTLESA